MLKIYLKIFKKIFKNKKINIFFGKSVLQLLFLQNTFSKKYVKFFGFSEIFFWKSSNKFTKFPKNFITDTFLDFRIFFWKSSNKFTKFLKIPEAPKSTRPKIPSSLWHGINAMHETMDTGQAPVPGNHQLQ